MPYQTRRLIQASMSPDPVVILQRKQDHHAHTAHGQDNRPQNSGRIEQTIQAENDEIRNHQAKDRRQNAFDQLDRPDLLSIALQRRPHARWQPEGILL